MIFQELTFFDATHQNEQRDEEHQQTELSFGERLVQLDVMRDEDDRCQANRCDEPGFPVQFAVQDEEHRHAGEHPQ